MLAAASVEAWAASTGIEVRPLALALPALGDWPALVKPATLSSATLMFSIDGEATSQVLVCCDVAFVMQKLQLLSSRRTMPSPSLLD